MTIERRPEEGKRRARVGWPLAVEKGGRWGKRKLGRGKIKSTCTYNMYTYNLCMHGYSYVHT